MEIKNQFVGTFCGNWLNVINGDHIMIASAFDRNTRLKRGYRIDINDNRSTFDLVDVKCETVVHSFGQKNDLQRMMHLLVSNRDWMKSRPEGLISICGG